MATNTVNMTLRLPPELAAYLNVVSQKTGKSRHQVILDVLTQQYTPDVPTIISDSPKATNEVSSIDNILSMLKSLSERIDRLEQPKDVRDADDDDDADKSTELLEFYLGQEITGQHSKLYQILLRNWTTKQKLIPKVQGWRRKYYTFALFVDLGLVCIVNYSRNGKAKFKVYFKFDPQEECYISPDGRFLTKELNWLTAEDAIDDNHPDTSDKVSDDVIPEASRASEALDIPLVVTRPYQLGAVGVQLSLEELKQHLKAIGSTPNEPIEDMSSKLLEEGEVTELVDVDWLVYWLPTDYSDRHTWILSKKSSCGI